MMEQGAQPAALIPWRSVITIGLGAILTGFLVALLDVTFLEQVLSRPELTINEFFAVILAIAVVHTTVDTLEPINAGVAVYGAMLVYGGIRLLMWLVPMFA